MRRRTIDRTRSRLHGRRCFRGCRHWSRVGRIDLNARWGQSWVVRTGIEQAGIIEARITKTRIIKAGIEGIGVERIKAGIERIRGIESRIAIGIDGTGQS